MVAHSPKPCAPARVRPPILRTACGVGAARRRSGGADAAGASGHRWVLCWALHVAAVCVVVDDELPGGGLTLIRDALGPR